jgi:hypothetical protein
MIMNIKEWEREEITLNIASRIKLMMSHIENEVSPSLEEFIKLYTASERNRDEPSIPSSGLREKLDLTRVKSESSIAEMLGFVLFCFVLLCFVLASSEGS